MSKKNAYRVAIAGATGLVGETMLQILAERKFPVSELIPLASARSVGKTIAFGGRTLPVRDLATFDFAGCASGLSSRPRRWRNCLLMAISAASCANGASPRRRVLIGKAFTR